MLCAAWQDEVVVCAGSELCLHAGGATHRVRHPNYAARFVAVARAGARIAALDSQGELHIYEGRDRVAAIAAGSRDVLANAGGFAMLCDAGAVLTDGSGEVTARIDFPRPMAAAAGTALVLAGDDHRLAEWTGSELVDIPPSAEQVIGLAALTPRRFLCIGERNKFVLDLDQRELEAIDQPTNSALCAVSPDGSQIAWPTSMKRVVVGTLAGTAFTQTHVITYPSTNRGQYLPVRGLAFADDRRLVIALPEGLGDIVDLAEHSSRKLDTRARARWTCVVD